MLWDSSFQKQLQLYHRNPAFINFFIHIAMTAQLQMAESLADLLPTIGTVVTVEG